MALVITTLPNLQETVFYEQNGYLCRMVITEELCKKHISIDTNVVVEGVPTIRKSHLCPQALDNYWKSIIIEAEHSVHNIITSEEEIVSFVSLNPELFSKYLKQYNHD